MPFTGITIAGTDAAAVAKFRVRCPKAITITGATYCLPVGGGTADARSIVIGKSLAGTGAVAGLGTAIIGTAANNASGAITVTETDFAADDHLVVQVAAGTSANGARVDLAVEWIEDFE
jgi:hypothetical protein